MSSPIEKRPPARRTPERTPDQRTLAAAERWEGQEPVGKRRRVEVGDDGAVTRIERDPRTGDIERRRAPHPDTAEYHAARAELEIKEARMEIDAHPAEEAQILERYTADAQEFIRREPRRIS